MLNNLRLLLILTKVLPANYFSKTRDVSMAAAKPSTSAEQGTQPNQYNHQEHSSDRSSLSNFQAQIENVRSLENVDDHKLPVNEVSCHKLSTSLKGLQSVKMTASPHRQMNEGRRLIPIHEPVEKRFYPTKMERNIARHFSEHSVKQPPTNKDNFQQELLRGFTESNIDVHRPTSQTINIRIPLIRQNSTNLSNPINQTPQLTQPRQMQPNQLNSQRQLQIPKLSINFSIKPKDQKQMVCLQGVTKKMPPPIPTKVFKSIRRVLSTTQNNLLSNNPQLHARMSQQSTGDNNVDLITSPRNIIASETSDRQNTEGPSRKIYKPSRIQHTPAHENGYQNLCTQGQLVDQSTRTNSKTKRIHFMDDAARSPVSESHLNVMDDACQTDNCMVDETLSPNHAVTSDSDADTEEEVFSDHEMSADEAPAETTNNVYGTANDNGHGSGDRPRAARNSTARNHQINPKFVSEQQVLDNINTLSTQMGSNLRYTIDMYKNIWNSILDATRTYKTLLGLVKQLNTRNAASSSSPSSNLIQEVPRTPEERHTKVTASASSSNQDQHSNDVSNKMPNKNLYRFVLPPEYDAYDTRWTLKHRTSLPGIVELMPQSGVYISNGDLIYCQQVSKDCKSLARHLLPAVFNRNALSVCSSMSEKEQLSASNNFRSNIRPDLDDHACSALINYVLEHGMQCGWNTDLQPILSTLQSKMQEFRSKYSPY